MIIIFSRIFGLIKFLLLEKYIVKKDKFEEKFYNFILLIDNFTSSIYLYCLPVMTAVGVKLSLFNFL